jgi:hypothetical protein
MSASASLQPSYARRRNLVLLAAGLAATFIALAAAPSADAYRLGGKRWPGRTITYHNSATRYAWSVNQAIAAWNASGARIRFVRASRKRAKLLIKVGRPHVTGHEAGSADLGYVGCTYYVNRRCVRPRKGLVTLSPGWDRWTMLHVAAHELGHILGLDHEDRRCAVMNSLGNAAGGLRCLPGMGVMPGRWRCRVIELDDIRGAVRRYGGRARPVRPEPLCWIHPAPSPPLEVTATPSPYAQNPSLNWRNASTLRDGSYVVIARGDGFCPTTPDGGSIVENDRRHKLLVPVSAGTESGTYDSNNGWHVFPGRYCYTLWTSDEDGQLSTPVSVWLDVPVPPED